ncbi:MAG: hypothetical protein ACI92Z_002959 [Paracoccaceae bacterium]|jgi:hypothetical protein
MTPITLLLGVLFIGHSLFGPTNPQMLRQVLQSQSPTIQVSAQIINGAPLKYNWSNSAEAEGVDARVELPGGGYNAVILTEGIPLANQLKWNKSAEYAQRFYELATGANPDTQVYLQETWHSLDSGTGVDVEYDDKDDILWRDRLDQDLSVWQSIVNDVNTAHSGSSPDMVLLPAGQAMALLYDEIAAGEVTGIGDIRELFSDDIHPNDIGFYYLTMVQFAVLTGQSPVGLPYQLKSKYGKAYTTPSAELALQLQQIAAQAIGVSEETAQSPATRTTTMASTEPTDITGPVPMAIGLSAVNDWSVQQPFLDVMKTARGWIGHKSGQWGGFDYDAMVAGGYLDNDGWPTSIPSDLRSIGTMILTDLPAEAVSLAGRYRIRFEGTGIVEPRGRASNIRNGKNEIEFDFTPGPGSVDLRIQRTDRRKTGDYVRNITVVKLDHLGAFDRGEVFNPDWLARVNGFKALRFMDWMRTNHSTQSDWSNRPHVADFSYALRGVPAEVMIALANQLQLDAWFNMPHLADDAYVLAFATLVYNTLDPGLQAYVEFSNEVWNWQFSQAKWADEQALERWQTKDAWMQYFGLRAAEIAQIWTAVYGANAETDLINVIATQTGWRGLEQQILEAPLWVAEAPGRDAPSASFDAYAVTGYFGRVLGTQDRVPLVKSWISRSQAEAKQQADDQGLGDEAHDMYVATHRYDLANALAGQDLLDGSVSGDISDSLSQLLGDVLPYHYEVAKTHDLTLIMYEGGTHVVGVSEVVDDSDLTKFYTQLNYSDEMGALYVRLIKGWNLLGGQLFNAYSDVVDPTKWGSWGALRYLSDDNPRWDALVRFQ